MGKARNITSESVAQIVILRQEGLTQCEIARKLKLNQSIVSRAVKRYKETGSFCYKKSPGAPRCTSHQTDRMMRRMVVASPTCSSSEIQAKLPPDTSVSTRTIRRRLQLHFKLRAYHPASKPRLSTKNVKDRLAFALKYRNWTTEQWMATMFSDETIVKQFYAFSSHVRRPKGERHNQRYVLPRVKHSPSVMVWGAITGQGRAGLWFVPESSTLNSEAYLAILNEKVPNFMTIHNCSHFQHDGAPCHSSRKVKDWLSEQRIQVIHPWPGNSPDLNPIENCWAVMKKKVSILKPTSREDLLEKIRRVWCCDISPEYCAQLMKSMPDRIAAVIKAKGGLTKY